MPSEDVLNFLRSFNVIPLPYNQKKTDKIDYPREFGNKVLLDQPIMMALCSNLSYDRSDRFYQETKDNITKEIMVKNLKDLETFLADKEILINQYAYDQSEFKVNKIGGPLEKS